MESEAEACAELMACGGSEEEEEGSDEGSLGLEPLSPAAEEAVVKDSSAAGSEVVGVHLQVDQLAHQAAGVFDSAGATE